MSLASPFGATVLIAASCVLNWTVGIGLYQNFVVIPSWFANPPAPFARINHFGSSEVRFWIPMQSITVLALITALAVGWNDPVHKPLIIAALAFYLDAIGMTGAYLAPKIVRWGKMSPTNGGAPEFLAAGNRWMVLSWVRQGVMVIAGVLLLTALAV